MVTNHYVDLIFNVVVCYLCYSFIISRNKDTGAEEVHWLFVFLYLCDFLVFLQKLLALT
jgi:hypothetical protein